MLASSSHPLDDRARYCATESACRRKASDAAGRKCKAKGDGMGELLRKMSRGNYDKRSDSQLEDVAEGALLMQEQLARDIISLAREAGLEQTDPRVQRAVEIFEKLR